MNRGYVSTCRMDTIPVFILRLIIFTLGILIPKNILGQPHFDNLDNHVVSIPDSNVLIQLHERARQIKRQKPDSSFKLFQRIISETEKSGFLHLHMYALYNLAEFYNELGKYDKSLETYKRALSFHPKVKKHEIYVLLLNGITIPYFYTGRYDMAIAYSYKALQEMKMHPQKSEVQVMVYNTLGAMWLRMDEPEKALHYFKQGEAVAIKHGDMSGLSHLRSNIGGVFFLLKQYDTAAVYLEQAIQMEETFQIDGPPSSHQNLGYIYIFKNQPEKSIPLFEKALKYGKKTNNYFAVYNAHFGLGSAYYELKDYRAAEQMLTIAEQMLDTGQVNDTKESLYKKLAQVYEATGRYQKAYHYQQLHAASVLELFGKEKARVAEQSEAKYRDSEKDRQIIAHQLLIASQRNRLKDRNILIGAAIATTILLSMLLISLYRAHRHRHKMHAEKIRNMEQEQEIGKLKALMDGEERERSRIAHELHDGIGSQHSAMMLYLHSIQDRYRELGKTEEMQQVVRLLKETADELRATAHNLMPELLQQQGLRDAVKTFCERMSKSKSLELEFFAYGDLDRLEKSFSLILYRMVQELVQNVVKHASATRLVVMITLIDRQTTITVEDNGTGMMNLASDGMGLLSMKTRVRQLGGEMITESDEISGTTISIIFNNVELSGHEHDR